MALATTCPQCKTSFKVVPDQLKLRRGLVRCGVCQHVFSGVEHLRYVDKDEKTEKASPSTAPAALKAGAQPSTPLSVDDALAPRQRPVLAGLDEAPSLDIGEADDDEQAAPPPAGETGHADSLAAGQPDSDAAPAPEGHSSSAGKGADQPATSTRPSSGTAADQDAASMPAAQAGADDADSEASDRASPVARQPSGHDAPPPRRNSRSKRRWRRERQQQAAAAASPDDEALHTQFFMADHEDSPGTAPGPGSHTLPASLRHDSRPLSEEGNLDPDTLAAGALVSEANRIWRQQKPRRAEAGETADLDHQASPGEQRSGRRRASSRRAAASQLPRAEQPGQQDSSGWLTPQRRRRLAIGLLILAIIQFLALFRTEIAYHLPFLRPLAHLASSLTGQTIEAPMSLSSLSIESFELRSTGTPGRTRMTAILRNRSDLPARWPAMEMVLTGPSNVVLVRKILMPAHYLPASHSIQEGIPASSEQPLDLLLDTGDLNLAGYSVSLFYP